MYDSINSAAKGLLGEATSIACNCGKEFAVCGGWSPLLRNAKRFGHPGTRDVDLLFSDGADKNALQDVVSAFLENGYLVSAKHQFQVLRTLPVSGQDFVFNVDFLHPHEGDSTGELFVDHLSLPVRFEDFESTFVCMKSIMLPNAGFIFEGFVEKQSMEFLLPDGSVRHIEIPLIDEVGLLATKSKSCTNQKRPRDIFDIYLAISDPRNSEVLASQLQKLKERHESVFIALECIREGLDKWQNKFGAPAVFAEHGISFEEAAIEIRTFIKSLGFG